MEVYNLNQNSNTSELHRAISQYITIIPELKIENQSTMLHC